MTQALANIAAQLPARRLMREAGIDAARRAGGLTAGQRTRLLAAVAAVDAELAARRDRRVTIDSRRYSRSSISARRPRSSSRVAQAPGSHCLPDDQARNATQAAALTAFSEDLSTRS